MPYYHVIIVLKNDPLNIVELNLSEKELLKNIVEPYHRRKGLVFDMGRKHIDPNDIVWVRITKTEKFIRDPLENLRRTYEQLWEDAYHERNVTKSFIHHVPLPSQNVFIVHGRDHKPMAELKAMLYEFGLNPIVLHEQPSASRTIVEQLEKYSDVGYAFVILTPDDMGGSSAQIYNQPRVIYGDTYFVPDANNRARQNVVLEFGFFIGLLGRDRVCCLYKGDIELPSDMHGIVYVPFEESVSEIRDKIIEELKAAGYETKAT